MRAEQGNPEPVQAGQNSATSFLGRAKAKIAIFRQSMEELRQRLREALIMRPLGKIFGKGTVQDLYSEDVLRVRRGKENRDFLLITITMAISGLFFSFPFFALGAGIGLNLLTSKIRSKYINQTRESRDASHTNLENTFAAKKKLALQRAIDCVAERQFQRYQGFDSIWYTLFQFTLAGLAGYGCMSLAAFYLPLFIAPLEIAFVTSGIAMMGISKLSGIYERWSSDKRSQVYEIGRALEQSIQFSTSEQHRMFLLHDKIEGLEGPERRIAREIETELKRYMQELISRERAANIFKSEEARRRMETARQNREIEAASVVGIGDADSGYQGAIYDPTVRRMLDSLNIDYQGERSTSHGDFITQRRVRSFSLTLGEREVD